MKYRKKPVVIDAVQYVPENASELLQLLEGCKGWQIISEGLRLPTLEGDHTASPGDWIVKGVKGEYYPVKPDIFALTYDGPLDNTETKYVPFEQQEAEIDRRRRQRDDEDDARRRQQQEEEESPSTIGFSPMPMPSMPEPDTSSPSQGGFEGFSGGSGFEGGGGGSSWGGSDVDTSSPSPDFGDVSGGSSSTSD
jgi:uncharacterized membrane protein YgcG